jgi:large subunit ribosomal protein L17
VRHGVFGKKLGRDTNARKALAASLASALFEEGHIVTTEAKTKFVQIFAEKLITSAKRNSLHGQRQIAPRLKDQAFIKLITEIAPGFASRAGGYTRIIKMGVRKGDSAPLARIELLEWDKTKAKKLTKTPKPIKKVKPKSIKAPLKTVKKDEKPKSK